MHWIHLYLTHVISIRKIWNIFKNKNWEKDNDVGHDETHLEEDFAGNA
jgi:hypothetical protein